MTAGPWTLPNQMRQNLVTGALGNLTTLALNIALFTSTATSTQMTNSTTYAALVTTTSAEVANGNGYTTAGATQTTGAVNITLTSSGASQSITLTPVGNVAWTASGSGIAAYWAVLYEATSGNIVGYCNLDATPATVTVSAGNTLTIQATNPVLTVA